MGCPRPLPVVHVLVSKGASRRPNKGSFNFPPRAAAARGVWGIEKTEEATGEAS